MFFFERVLSSLRLPGLPVKAVNMRLLVN